MIAETEVQTMTVGGTGTNFKAGRNCGYLIRFAETSMNKAVMYFKVTSASRVRIAYHVGSSYETAIGKLYSEK